MAMKIHWHFKFIGYNKKGEGNQIMFPVEISIKSQDTEAGALFEAKQKIERKYYYCKEAWECSSCYLNEEQIESLKKTSRLMEEMKDSINDSWIKRLLRKKI